MEADYHTLSQIGQTWHCYYWHQNYTIAAVNPTGWLGMPSVTVRWADGRSTTHSTRIDKRDYRVS